MDPLENLKNQIPSIEKKLCYTFEDKDLLILAFVHRSFINEYRDLVKEHNERLEFLGDSVLGLLISEYLYKYLPSTPEGELSSLRSRLVEAPSCVSYVNKLDIADSILLGRGEQMNSGRGRDSILADLFEAVLGAIHLDGGIEAAKAFLFRTLSQEIDSILKQPLRNWKAELQDYAQKKHQEPPHYKVLEESGPDHKKTFSVAVLINGKEMGRGLGRSKKEAQQEAAKAGLETVNG